MLLLKSDEASIGGRGSDGDHQGDCETYGIFAGHGVASVEWRSAQAKRIVIPHEVALLDNEESDETLRDSYFADLRSALEHNAKQQRMELTVFHSLDEMLNQKGKFDGFMAIGANVIAESDLEKLHEVMPYGVFIDVNPADHA